MNLEEVFLSSCRTDYNISKNTRETYLGCVKRFSAFLEERHVQIEDINIRVLIDFFATLPYSVSLKRLMIAALRKLGNTLVLNNIIPKNIFLKLGLPRRVKRIPKVFTVEEVDRFLDIIDTSTLVGIRDRAMFELIYSAGLKASEAANAELKALYLKECFLLVTGNGDKQRMVLFGDVCRRKLTEYLEYSRPFLTNNRNSGYIFMTTQGTKMTRNEIWYRFEKYREKVGLEGSVNTLRHSFATHLVKNGMDLKSVSELLGHSNLTTTSIYTHLDKDYLREVHHKYFPAGALEEDSD